MVGQLVSLVGGSSNPSGPVRQPQRKGPPIPTGDGSNRPKKNRLLRPTSRMVTAMPAPKGNGHSSSAKSRQPEVLIPLDDERTGILPNLSVCWLPDNCQAAWGYSRASLRFRLFADLWDDVCGARMNYATHCGT